MSGNLFEPFADSLKALQGVLTEGVEKSPGSPQKTLDNNSISDKIKVTGKPGNEDSNHPSRKSAGANGGLQWVTINGARVPLDNSGNVKPGGQANLQGEKFSTAKSKMAGASVSASGKNDPPEGFASAQKAKKHYDKHVGKDNATLYIGMSRADYETHAKEFLSKACDENIDGYKTSDGAICRFDKRTGEYAKGYPGGVIKTCMVAKVNRETGESNLETAKEYFEARKAKEGVGDGNAEA